MGRISAFGVALEEVPKWAIAVVALTLALAVGWKTVLEPKWDREALQADLDEFARHYGESPEGPVVVLLDDVRGRLTAQRYQSDGCVALVRVFNGVARTKLIPDFALGPAPVRRAWRDALIAPLIAAVQCLYPHPGPFEQRAGRQQGCWVPVVRQWADGCAYTQLFNTCDRTWDANIQWIRCNH